MKRTALPVDLSGMQKTLKDHREGLGKVTQPHHYCNEVRLINYAVTGSPHSCYRNLYITRDLTRAIRRVVCLNGKLIKLHVQYPDRKKSCRDLFLRVTSVTSQN